MPPDGADAATGDVTLPALAAPVTRQALARSGNLREEAERRLGTAPRKALGPRTEARVERAPRVGPARTGPSLLDQASANLGYIRADLARIGVLASLMVAVIVALSFVLA